MGKSKKLEKRLARWAGLFLAFLARRAWRHRAGLVPVWWYLAMRLLGWLGSWWPPYWPYPVTAATVIAGVLWFAGERMSPWAQQTWLALIPDSLDDGRPGVLDRPTERGYLAALVFGCGAWVSLRMQYGYTDQVRYVLYGLFASLGMIWWWHRGWRRRKPLNRYGRRWNRVEQNEDLKPWHGSKRVGCVDSPNATCLKIKLRGGRTIKHVGGDALILCSQLGLRPGAITVSQDPDAARRVLVRIVPRDPWRAPILHPMPPLRSIPLAKTKCVMVGKYEDGTPDLLKITQHILCVGATGTGKSEWMQSLAAWILCFDHSAIVGADLASGATFDIWSEVFAHPLATDPNSAMDLLKRVFQLIEYRERELARRRRAGELINVLPPSAEHPWLWVIIDEFPDLIKSARMVEDERGEKHNVIVVLERIANKARKVGIWLVLGAQNPTTDDVGSTILRGAMGATVGLGLDQRQSMTLWGSLRQEGWASEGLTVGQYLCHCRNDADHKMPRVAKGLFLPPEMRARLIESASRRPSRLPDREARILVGPDGIPLPAPRIVELEGESPRPQLTVVPPPGIPITPPQPGRSSSQALAELDDNVFAEIPGRNQHGIGQSSIAAQLGVNPGRVKRALQRLRQAGRIESNGDGTWCRTD